MELHGREAESKPLWWRKRSEGGFVVVWFSLMITVLLGLAGCAVDFGNWYLSIQKIQRASDAAALAGDPYMPVNYTTPLNGVTARTAARDALLRNGVPAADAQAAFNSTNCNTAYCIRQVPNKPTQLQVKVQVTVKNTFFRMLGIANQNRFTRQAIADYTPELHITSESNVLGGPEPNDGSGTWGPPPNLGNANYWLQLGGRETSKTEGDRLNSLTCTPNSFGNYDPDRCSSSRNDEYMEFRGYLYLIDVKPNTTVPNTIRYLEIQQYDANMTMAYSGIACPAKATCPADELYGVTNVNQLASARFAFYKDDTFVGVPTAETYCPAIVPRAGPVKPTWEPVCPGTVKERIAVDMSKNTRIYMRLYSSPGRGTNHFMLRAGLFTSASGGTVLNPVSYTNVQISADEHMPIYNEIDGGGSTGGNSTFTIGQINSAWAGRTIHFEFWDVGDAFDGSAPVDGWLYLQGASGTVAPALAGNCVYTKPKAGGNENTFSNAPIKGCGFPVTVGEFNGKLVKLNWKVPANYKCELPKDCTLAVTMDMNGKVADDTVTSVREPGMPLRLVK